MYSNLGQLQPHHTPLPDHTTVGFMGDDGAGPEHPANAELRVPKQVSFGDVTHVIGVAGAGPDLPANPPPKQVSFEDVVEVIGVVGSGPELPATSPSERINAHSARKRLDRVADSKSAPMDKNDENTLSVPAPPKSKKVTSAESVDVHHKTNNATDKVRVERSVLIFAFSLIMTIQFSSPVFLHN